MTFFNPKNIFKDLFIVTCIVVLPFVFYLYNVAPHTKTWKNSWFEIDSGNFEDVNYFLWFLSVKLLTLLLLTLWYITCKHQWRIVLFVPILFELFKFFFLIMSSKFDMVNEELTVMHSIFYSIPYVILLLFFSKKLNYYKPNKQDINSLNNKINSQILKLSKFDYEHYKSVKKDLKLLEDNKSSINKKDYLTKLITLRDQLY